MMHAATHTTSPLLVELFTEELPPRALRALGEAFGHGISEGLKSCGLVASEPPAETETVVFSTPRRLAVRIDGVRSQAEDRMVEAKGPSVKVGLDSAGQPTQALIKWAERQGAHLDELTQGSDG
jgi:glycyl-tRNA synthetase beta chain